MRDLNTDGHYNATGANRDDITRLAICKTDIRFFGAVGNVWNKGDILILQGRDSKSGHPDIYYVGCSGIYVEDFEIDILPQDIIEHIITYHLKYKTEHPMCKCIVIDTVGGRLLQMPD